jgi:hypothetical protein
MKKLMVIGALSLLFLSMVSLTSVPVSTASKTGTFEGNVGYRVNGSWVPIGNISGAYTDVGWLGYRWGRFNGSWSVEKQNITGTMQGRFRLVILGSISAQINETQRRFPIVGFLGGNNKGDFVGRCMSYVGPALYVWGTYQLD